MARKSSRNGTPFTSLRVIGEKAQKLLAKARALRFRVRRAERTTPPQQHDAVPEMTIFLSITSVVQATFVILGITLLALLLYLLQDKIVLFLLSVFVAVVLEPGLNALQRLRIPRGFGILILYAVAIFVSISLLVSLIPILASQIQQIAAFMNEQVNAFLDAPSINLPILAPDVNARLTALLLSALHSIPIQELTQSMQTFGQSLAFPAEGSLFFAARLAGSVLNFFVNLVIVLVFAFFLQIERERIFSWIRSFLPWNVRDYVDDKSERIQWKLGQWARGQLILCLSICALVFLALIILRMPYALTLAVLAGFTELVPVIGIFVAAIPAVLIALTQQGIVWAVMLASIYYVIQWCESNLLAPLIMKRTVDLSPIAVLFAMLVGVSFPSVIHPILGIMLAIPLTTVVTLFLEDWSGKP